MCEYVNPCMYVCRTYVRVRVYILYIFVFINIDEYIHNLNKAFANLAFPVL